MVDGEASSEDTRQKTRGCCWMGVTQQNSSLLPESHPADLARLECLPPEILDFLFPKIDGSPARLLIDKSTAEVTAGEDVDISDQCVHLVPSCQKLEDI